VAELAVAKKVHDICKGVEIGVWSGDIFETRVGRAVIVVLAGITNFICFSHISA
jgi:hypothetical protein